MGLPDFFSQGAAPPQSRYAAFLRRAPRCGQDGAHGPRGTVVLGFRGEPILIPDRAKAVRPGLESRLWPAGRPKTGQSRDSNPGRTPTARFPNGSLLTSGGCRSGPRGTAIMVQSATAGLGELVHGPLAVAVGRQSGALRRPRPGGRRAAAGHQAGG